LAVTVANDRGYVKGGFGSRANLHDWFMGDFNLFEHRQKA